MTSLDKHGTKILAAIALTALFAAPAIGQEAAAAEIAAVETSPAGVSWTPRAGFDNLVLTVEGGGFTITREFAGGQPYFSAVDPDGFQLPDGTYVWELTGTQPAPRAAASEDELSANGRTTGAAQASRALVQSGAFTIADGAIVGPGVAARSAEGAEAADDADAASQ